MSLQFFTLSNPQIIIIYFLTGATSGSTNSPGLYCLDLISLDKASLHANYRVRYLSIRSSLVLVEVQNKFLVLLVVNTLKLGGVFFFSCRVHECANWKPLWATLSYRHPAGTQCSLCSLNQTQKSAASPESLFTACSNSCQRETSYTTLHLTRWGQQTHRNIA